jgi:hypothetical protein
MAKEFLVDENIDDGANLIYELDQSNVQIDAALWFYFTEAEEWRLIIATPIIDKKGPVSAYKKIIEFIKEKNLFFHTPIRKLTILSPHDPLIKLLKIVVKTGPSSIARIRFQNNVINNVPIDDALIYRIQ